MPCRGDAVDACRYAACGRDLLGHLRARQHAAVAGLGTLRQLDFDHLDLRIGGCPGEQFGREAALGSAAAEIAAADLPDNVAAALAVVATESALAGVVREASELGTPVERANGVGRERAEAHRGNIEERNLIGLGAERPADADTERAVGLGPNRRQR